MGLIRASIITSIIYGLWKVIDTRFAPNMSPENRAKWMPLLPLVLVFVIEVLL